MISRNLIEILVLLSLSCFVVCDNSLVVGIDYYISSVVNSAFINNLVGYTDGITNWPGIGKDETGTHAYARWYLVSIAGSGKYQLSNDAGLVLDIKGGKSSAPNNPTPFLNSIKDTTLDGQSSWTFVKAKETNLVNQDNGYWAAIVNTAWNLALRAPIEAAGIEAEVVDLAPVPSSWDSGRYWFFASVTRGTVWNTATVTQITTVTGSPATQIINADGPTSTITSTIVKSFTTTVQVTSTVEAKAGRDLARRYDFTTVTSTTTSTRWQTSTAPGAVVKVTSQGGFVYETNLVTSSAYATETSTIIITKTPETSLAQASTTKSLAVEKTDTQSHTSGTATSTSSGSNTAANSAQNTSTGTGETMSQNKKSVPVAAIVGGVLGGVLLIVILIAFLLFRKYRRRGASTTEDSAANHRRSELHSNSMISGSHFSGSVPDTWHGDIAVVDEKRGEVRDPNVAEVHQTPVARTRTIDGVARGSRHELDGLGANLNEGPRYEMPGHDNWR